MHRCDGVRDLAPLVEDRQPDVILLDLSLPEPTPLVAYAIVSAAAPGVPIVLLSAAEKEGVAIRVVHQGAADYVLEKQASSTLLVRTLAAAVQRAHDARALREAHERFDAFFNQTHDAVFIASADGVVLEANEAFRSLFGLTESAIPGLKMGQLFVDGEQLARLASDLRTHGWTRESPVQLRSADGGVLDCRISATARRDAEGRVVDYQAIIRDVSEEVRLQQERAEALHREQQMRLQAEAARHRFSQILESISDAFFTLDREWRFTHVNGMTEEATRKYLGVGRGDLLDRSFWEVLPEMHGTEFEAQYTRALESGNPARFEAYFEPLDAWFFVRAYPSPEGLSIFFHDVTEQKRTEQALTESEAKFRQIADNIRETFWMFNADFTRTIYVNKGYEALWGRSVKSLYDDARSLFEGIHSDDVGRVLQVIGHACQGESKEIEYRVVRPDGSVRWAWSRGFPIFDERGELYRVVGTTEDITERKQTELELAAAEAHYRRLVETSPYAIFACDPESRFTELNPAAAEILGRPAAELLGHCMTEIIAPEDRPEVYHRLDERLTTGMDLIDHEVHVVRPSGERRLIHVRSTVIRDGEEVVGTHGIVRDITDERAQETILRRTERLASVGTLIGGVAHELNNPLHAIRNFADLMLVDERNEDDQEAL
ncbi:MAG TPA: PAS domain S-box protein, partial [Longimicrobiaceae bacterium]|nr:PAS domain S-box protein [Longimicrobiaceae bacterium]